MVKMDRQRFGFGIGNEAVSEGSSARDASGGLRDSVLATPG
jgi:hypothetical protein